MIYCRNDKVMVQDTGEVFTVFRDLGFSQTPAIMVSERIGEMFARGDVRPAGHTRQRADLARDIIPPEIIPPRPENPFGP